MAPIPESSENPGNILLQTLVEIHLAYQNPEVINAIEYLEEPQESAYQNCNLNSAYPEDPEDINPIEYMEEEAQESANRIQATIQLLLRIVRILRFLKISMNTWRRIRRRLTSLRSLDVSLIDQDIAASSEVRNAAKEERLRRTRRSSAMSPKKTARSTVTKLAKEKQTIGVNRSPMKCVPCTTEQDIGRLAHRIPSGLSAGFGFNCGICYGSDKKRRVCAILSSR